MKALFIATVAAFVLVSGSAFAADKLKDYSDKSITCDKDDIKDHMESMIENGPAGKLGVRLLYIKGQPAETSRNKDELRCKITVVTNSFTMAGIFRFYNEDDVGLVEWNSKKTK